MLDRLRSARYGRSSAEKDLSGGVKIVIIKRSDLRAVGAAVARPPHTRSQVQILYCPPFKQNPCFIHGFFCLCTAVSAQTALRAAGFERRSDVFV